MSWQFAGPLMCSPWIIVVLAALGAFAYALFWGSRFRWWNARGRGSLEANLVFWGVVAALLAHAYYNCGAGESLLP